MKKSEWPIYKHDPKSHTLDIKCCDLSTLKAIAGLILQHIITPGIVQSSNNCVILLTGEIGAGKTTFVKMLLEPLLPQEGTIVSSPTFTLLNIYDCQALNKHKFQAWHYDLYRIKNVLELEEIGLVDALTNKIVIIEWPEILLETSQYSSLLKESERSVMLKIDIKFECDNTELRNITIEDVMSRCCEQLEHISTLCNM